MTPFSRHGNLITLAAAATLASAVREFSLVNNCPSGINVFVNGSWSNWLPANGGSAISPFSNNFSGFIYTNANGGSPSGEGTTRAGFFGQNAYYYLVTDPEHFNVEIEITPSKNPFNDFCVPASCSSLGCPTAFTFPPTRFPPPSFQPPNPPLYACPQRPNNVGFTVTFCPNGFFPPVTRGLQLHPNFNQNKCLDVRGARYRNGTPVQIYDCNGSGAQKWILSRGRTQLQVAGTNFCLDAGSHPGNGVGMKIWECYEGLAAQEWIYSRNRVRLAGQSQCLDLTEGIMTNGNQVQTWQCSSGNRNQVWTV